MVNCILSNNPHDVNQAYAIRVRLTVIIFDHYTIAERIAKNTLTLVIILYVFRQCVKYNLFDKGSVNDSKPIKDPHRRVYHDLFF